MAFLSAAALALNASCLAPDSPVDCEVLRRIHNRTWNEQDFVQIPERRTSVCSWPGVVCGKADALAQSRIKELRLGAALAHAGTLPTEIGRLDSLRVLQVHRNSLSGTLPSTLGVLTGLTDLWLGANAFSGTLPTELARLSQMVEMQVHKNSISGFLPATLAVLPLLSQTQLHRNALSGTLPTQLGQMTWLQRIDISENRLSGTFPLAFCRVRAEYWPHDKCEMQPTGTAFACPLPDCARKLCGVSSACAPPPGAGEGH